MTGITYLMLALYIIGLGGGSVALLLYTLKH